MSDTTIRADYYRLVEDAEIERTAALIEQDQYRTYGDREYLEAAAWHLQRSRESLHRAEAIKATHPDLI